MSPPSLQFLLAGSNFIGKINLTKIIPATFYHFLYIRVKSYCHLNLLRASVFNFERLDILRDSIGHLSKNLLWFEFARSYYFQFGTSRYITGLNKTYELKNFVVWLFLELPFSISTVSISDAPESDLRVKSYDLLSCSGASIVQFLASRYITRLNQTSE